MIFGDLKLAEAEGAILAHSVRADGIAFKKGRILSAEDLAVLRDRGIDSVTAARLGPDDVHEDEAAERLAAALSGDGISAAAPFTGRVNLFAAQAGLAVLDRARIDAINQIDEAITVATLPEYEPVQPRQMVATVKIIPFAAPAAPLARCEAMAAESNRPAIRVAPFRPLRTGLIQTSLPGTPEKLLDKTARVTADRLAALGCTLATERRCSHAVPDLAETIAAMRDGGVELLLIAGASAITDRRDILPAAIEAAGGTVEHFGMPVDPGNLLLLARFGQLPVFGLPGCARSPKLNGFDWVLRRLVAGVPVARADITAMGVGGLLTEIPSRPQPRSGPETGGARAPRIAALVLAAGRSSRMGPSNKLLADIGGMPMIARTVDAVLASQASPVLVVTGHQGDQVAAALAGRPVTFVANPDYAEGLSTSLRAGIAALPADVDGVVICLGDMPLVTARSIDRLLAAYAPEEGRAIVVPTRHGKRGNPVLWDCRFFPEIAAVSGDVGARHLIGDHAPLVAEVELGDDGVAIDVDTPEALAAITRTSAEG